MRLEITTILYVFFSQSIEIIIGRHESTRIYQCKRETDGLKSIVERMIEEIAMHSDCIVFITDPAYRGLIDMHIIEMSFSLSIYNIAIRDNDNFSRPRKLMMRTLERAKAAGCDAYVILIANGLLTSRFLQYSEGPELHYIWNRIINVVFVRRYNMYKHRSGERVVTERIDLNTVHYPSGTRDVTTTKYIDTWYDGRLRYDNDHYASKSKDLHGNGLRVAVFEHIPAVTKASRDYYQSTTISSKALGIEFELIRVIAKAMNFKANYYMPYNIEKERWGKAEENDSYTGLLGEAIAGNADFFLGDLHYTMYHLSYVDLSAPYNTECLTFLTPESLTDNSWKLLILPFRLNTWIAVLCTLLMASGISHILALSFKKYVVPHMCWELGEANAYNSTSSLYLFTELQNSVLYTYSMLLQVSLPRLPNAWAIRIFIGWWWIYSILATVTYRASMTATLSHPDIKVTIDTLAQLTRTKLAVGGWSEESKEFFLTSSDRYSQEVGSKFEIIESEDDAIDRVANGTFGYYENAYVLRHIRGKRIFQEGNKRRNKSIKDTESTVKYNLHIMDECVVHMPIALGLEKNSPLKPHVDLWVRRMTEIGLVRKWLSDVMEWSKISETLQKSQSETALVNLRKLYGAFVALAIGYFFGFAALLGEILYWKYVVLRDPNYDKYHLDTFYKNNKCKSSS